MITLQLNKSVSARFLKRIESSPELVNQAIDIALKRIGLQIRNQARQDAPYKMGVLRRSIIDQYREEDGRKEVAIGSPEPYARIQDLGGVIRPKNARFLRFEIGGRVIFTKGPVTIPKYKGRGYLKPAFEQVTKSEAKRILRSEIYRILS